MIFYNRQSIAGNDIKAVNKVLKSDIITRGNIVSKFEKKLSKFTGSKFGVTFNSASSALTGACFAIGLKKNDIVWTVPNSFVASASAARHFSSKIDFVDIDRIDKNISVIELEKKLLKAKKNKTLPRILITVHFGGQPPDQAKIYNLSKEYKFFIIEDASHSLGGFRDKEKVGSCKWSDIVVTSFHPVKTITTGEGGIALSNNKTFIDRLKIYRNNGITRNFKSFKRKNRDHFYYEQQFLGHNYHMSDINAALGISQLKRIKQFIKKRNQIFNYYNNNLKTDKIILPKINKKNKSTHHLYVINLKNKKNRKKIFLEMKKKGVILNVHYIPIHLHPYYYDLGFRKGNFPNSEWHYETSISLPIFVDLSLKNLKKIVRELNYIIENKI